MPDGRGVSRPSPGNRYPPSENSAGLLFIIKTLIQRPQWELHPPNSADFVRAQTAAFAEHVDDFC